MNGPIESVDPCTLDKLITKVDVLKESERHLAEQPVVKRAHGLDIGTSRVVGIKQGDTIGADQLTGFIIVPETRFLKDMLMKNHIACIKIRDKLTILGYDAQKFANVFNSEIRRPMKKGLISLDETDAIPVMKEIINLVFPWPREVAQPLCFSVPAPRAGSEADLVFHENIMKMHMARFGFKARSISEGMAVVLAELADDNYTGIGISMGAGTCNVCFSFLSVPVIAFSIGRGGDDIDISAARMLHETENRVRVIKEESLDFTRSPHNNMENALTIFYEDLIRRLLNHLSEALSSTENLPRLSKPVPIILAGGTCLPNGFKVKFEQLLKEVNMPIGISSVHLAHDPLRTTAMGALISALAWDDSGGAEG